MCNFYMMYYRDASSNIETPEVCAQQYTYTSLYGSFPNGSDVALHSGPGHHHHHHHGHQSSPEGDDVTDSNDVTNVSHATNVDDVTDRDNVPTGNDVIGAVEGVASNGPTVQTTHYQRARESTNGNPTTETTQPSQVKTSRSVTHDVTSDITTSTSVSEQTTRPSDLVQDKSTRLNLKVTTNDGPRTTRSTEESKSTQPSLDSDKREHQSHVKTFENNERAMFNVSAVDAWPSAVTEGLGQVTGLAVDSAGRLFVFHRSERIWDYE